MPSIQPVKATDTGEAVRSKQNAAIIRVNELDNTAADIAAMASSANAAMRNAALARDEARDIAATVSGNTEDAQVARDAAIVARLAAETARNGADNAAIAAAASEAEAEAQRVLSETAREGSEEARDAAAISRGAAHTSAAATLMAAEASQEAREDAEAAALRSEEAENSLLEWKGAWATGTSYELSDIVRSSGSSYICLIAHTSGTFSTDLGAGRWELFAQQGATGPGSGDMLASVYDVGGRGLNVYQRGNHLGEQPISTVTGLQTALNGKAASSHTHTVANVTGLQATLTGLQAGIDGKAASGHTHPAATPSAAGFMTGADKGGLDRLQGGNQAELDAGASENKRGWSALSLFTWLRAKVFGIEQEWYDMKASRAFNVPYQNDTGRPIMVAIGGNSSTSENGIQVSKNGMTGWMTVSASAWEVAGTTVVPTGWWYRYNKSGGISHWNEMR